jgi:hypothetical protein
MVYSGGMGQVPDDLRPLAALIGGEADVRAFHHQAWPIFVRAMSLKLAILGTACAMLVNLARQPANAGWEILCWVLTIAVAFPSARYFWGEAGRTSWSSASVPPRLLRALDLLAAGELRCFVRTDRMFRSDCFASLNPEGFRSAFTLMLFSPSGVWKWLGKLDYLGNSNKSYLVSGAVLDRLLAPPTPNWRDHPTAHRWEQSLLLPKADFYRVLDKAFPAYFEQPSIRKPRIALETAHALLAVGGPELDQEAVAAEARHAIRRAGYLNAALRDARLSDGSEAEPTKKFDEGWVIVALKGEHARIRDAMRAAQKTSPDSERVESLPRA